VQTPMNQNLLLQNFCKQQQQDRVEQQKKLQQQHKQQQQQIQQQLIHSTIQSKLPFPTQRIGPSSNALAIPPAAPSVPVQNMELGGTSALQKTFQNNLLAALQQNMINRSQNIIQAMSQGQTAGNAMSNQMQMNTAQINIANIINMAKDSNMQKNITANQNQLHQDQIRQYHQCALLDRMKQQSMLMNSQV
jgi:hypothetical protein